MSADPAGFLAQLASAPAPEPVEPPLEHEEVESLQRQLTEARKNLRLIEEREAAFVMSTDVPLQLVKEKRSLQERIAALKRKLGFSPGGSA